MRISTLFSFLFCFLFFISISAQDAISIAEARSVDAEGSLNRLGQMVELTGLAIGPNFRGGGHTWVLFDVNDNIGITVFAFNNDVGYSVTDGDELRVIGELDEFNGLAEIIPESIEVISSGNAIPDPEVVTEMGETTEAKLIRIENVSLVDESQWGSSNFNVDLTDGTNTFQMRIDGDTDIAGMAAPQGTFTVTGIGGQFDNEEPYFQGYQIFPRAATDIDPYDTGGTGGIEYEEITLEQAREIDLNGISERLDDNVAVRGVTHGINFRPSGLQFTIINDNNVGLNVFLTSNPFGYEFNEGDELLIKGKMDQFSGLTQINPDSLFVLSQGNDLVTARQVESLDETTEASLVEVQMSEWVDPTQWRGDGSSFNVDFITLNGQELTMRIDSDTELASSPIPSASSYVTGLGGQFDSSEPYDEGYQIFPYKLSNFDPYLSLDEIPAGSISIHPNPASDWLQWTSEINIELAEVFDLSGRKVISLKNPSSRINLTELGSGMYLLRLSNSESYFSQWIAVER